MSWPLAHTWPEMTVSFCPSVSQLVYAVPLA